MARQYNRETNKGSASLDDLQRAAGRVSEGRSKIDRMTVKRYISNTNKREVPTTGYSRLAKAH